MMRTPNFENMLNVLRREVPGRVRSQDWKQRSRVCPLRKLFCDDKSSVINYNYLE